MARWLAGDTSGHQSAGCESKQCSLLHIVALEAGGRSIRDGQSKRLETKGQIALARMRGVVHLDRLILTL
jgi:hypothetical protein